MRQFQAGSWRRAYGCSVSCRSRARCSGQNYLSLGWLSLGTAGVTQTETRSASASDITASLTLCFPPINGSTYQRPTQNRIKQVTGVFQPAIGQGKFIRIHFGATGKLASADIETCKSRHLIQIPQWFATKVTLGNLKTLFCCCCCFLRSLGKIQSDISVIQ